MNLIKAGEAASRFLEYSWKECLDIGSGDEEHADYFRARHRNVVTLDKHNLNANIQKDYLEYHPTKPYEAIWCSHVLEHVRDTGTFLDKIHFDLKEGGVLAITVPPRKDEIVGGHVSLWNAGLLLYNLILSGFDCSQARVATYKYNVSVVVRKKTIRVPEELSSGRGDIELISAYFPFEAKHGFYGNITQINWG